VLFPTRRNSRLSRDAVGHLVTKHSITAQGSCPSLKAKHPKPHTLRHSCVICGAVLV
jgi:site-specific recombinase XerD